MNKSYTYLVGWTKHNLWYYGLKFSKNADPLKFWVNYFTSSKEVKRLRKIIGEPDVIQIRRTFESTNKAIEWEYKVLKRIKAVYLDKWLNKSAGHYLQSVKAFTKSGKEIVVEFNDPRFESKEIFHYNSGYALYRDLDGNVVRKRIIDLKPEDNLTGMTKGRQFGENNPFYGRTHTEESLMKMRKPHPNAKTWNKGLKVEYDDKWRESIRNRTYKNGAKSATFGSRWLRNDDLKQKTYTNDNNLIEILLKTGWVYGRNRKNEYTSMKAKEFNVK